MPEPADANELVQLAVRCGLIEEATARELLYELDDPKGPATDMARLMERKRLLTPLQSGKLLKGESDGYFLGGYRLLYKIASGSFGRVYRGDDPRSGRVVAVKVLRKRWLDTPKRVESFEREGRLGMTLDHPNIVRILNVGKDSATGQHFIIMDFVEGGNLKDILNIRKTVGIDEALRIMEESVNGLAYSYSRGLTHRDIKASNILLGTDKVAKLVDFGLAETTDVQQEILFVGVKTEKDERPERTVDYAGLEKATGVSSGDVRSDIYFLGHVLFEMVAGKPLLPPTKNPHTRMSRRRFEEVEPTLEREARALSLPPAFVRLIAKAVALEPSQRFQTPVAFLDAIKRCRVEVSGAAAGTLNSRRAEGPLTIFVAEPNPKLQAVFREKLKEYGFNRVLISIDPDQVVKRYQQQPYHACLIDAGALGREGLNAFKRVVRQADADQRDLAAVVILNDDQRDWVDDAMSAGGGEVMLRPVTMAVLHEVLAEHLPELKKSADIGSDETES
ncbi:MAG: serine/threonine-protein kinase [Fimbriiglobus sp.]|jgi:serine/threonine protein kinase|nr:serine/threonine-protein kinase [Fimbriiglobus sp.]